MPQVWLAREIRKDGGGFGKFRGGNGIHSLYFIPEGIEMEMGSFGSPPIFSSAGLMGGYPASPLRVWVGRNTNLKEMIASGARLPNGEGDNPAIPDFVKMVDGDWEYVPGQNYPSRSLPANSMFSVVSGDGGGYGDPLEREPSHVIRDLLAGVTTLRTSVDVYGVVIVSDESGHKVDEEATLELRSNKRKQRLARGIPAKLYKEQMRRRVVEGDIPTPAKALYIDVLHISKKWAEEFRTFWSLPDDFEVSA